MQIVLCIEEFQAMVNEKNAKDATTQFSIHACIWNWKLLYTYLWAYIDHTKKHKISFH